jgi:protein-S-isoprenylcysteine O-methyltransferase Ste14
MAEPLAAEPSGAERPKPLLSHPFRRKKLQPRPLTIHATAIFALLAAQPTAASLAAGIPLVAAGQALRLWATGHLRKTDDLSVTGPYAYLRHPLYAGALAMGCGFAIMAGPQVAVVVLPLGFAFFFLYYLPRKERIESERLAATHGASYRAYRAQVGALVPRRRAWRPAPRGAPMRWSIARVRDNNEQSTLAWALVATAALLAKGWL